MSWYIDYLHEIYHKTKLNGRHIHGQVSKGYIGIESINGDMEYKIYIWQSYGIMEWMNIQLKPDIL